MDEKNIGRDHDKRTMMTASKSCVSSVEAASLSLEAPRKRVKIETDEQNATNVAECEHVETGAVILPVAEMENKDFSCSDNESRMNSHMLPKHCLEQPYSSAHVLHTIDNSKSHLAENGVSSAAPMSELTPGKRKVEKAAILSPCTMVPNRSNEVDSSALSTIGSSQHHSLPLSSSPVPNDVIREQSDTSEVSSSLQQTAIDKAISSNQEPKHHPRSTSFLQLRLQYFSELEYMLREFQKLERQLLGANTQSSFESAGSKERREKLHSFILHLEETIQQIVAGCDQETNGETISSCTRTQSDVEDENVQKLEEHILANLLPVKVRLKRQLAAQQGAKHNPAGMPTVRGLQVLGSGAHQAKATFLRQGTVRRQSHLGGVVDNTSSSLNQTPDFCTPKCKESMVNGITAVAAESESSMNQCGKPLTITKSNETPDFSTVPRGSNQVFMAQGSKEASMLSADNAKQRPDNRVTRTDSVRNTWTGSRVKPPDVSKNESNQETLVKPTLSHPIPLHAGPALASSAFTLQHTHNMSPVDQVQPPTDQHLDLVQVDSVAAVPPMKNCLVNDDERRRILKRRRKKKKRVSDTEKCPYVGNQIEGFGNRRSKKAQTHRGPRNVEYICALCNEIYNSTCEFNPWWALTQHDCPKCQKLQIPRVDISAPANAIEYHPALLAHVDENGGGNAPTSVMFVPPKLSLPDNASDSESDLSDDDGLLSDGEDSLDSSNSATEDAASMSITDQAENEKFGLEYDGPKLPLDHAARLLVLILHASTCLGHRLDPYQDDVCRSTKWMMLHVRDCPGITPNGDMCPFPWCRKVKHLLYHLVSCDSPDLCSICSPRLTNVNMRKLNSFNWFRLRKHQMKADSELPSKKENGTATNHLPITIQALESNIAPTVELNAKGKQLEVEEEHKPTMPTSSLAGFRRNTKKNETSSKVRKNNTLPSDAVNLQPISMMEQSFSVTLAQATTVPVQKSLTRESNDGTYNPAKLFTKPSVPSSDGLHMVTDQSTSANVASLSPTDVSKIHFQAIPDEDNARTCDTVRRSSLTYLEKGKLTIPIELKSGELFTPKDCSNTSKSEVLPVAVPGFSSCNVQSVPYVEQQPAPLPITNPDHGVLQGLASARLTGDSTILTSENAKLSPDQKTQKEILLIKCQESIPKGAEGRNYDTVETLLPDNTRRQEFKSDSVAVPENRLSSENLVLRVQ